MSLVQSVMAHDPILNLTFQIAQSLGWVGAILSVEARIVAEQKPVGKAEPATEQSGEARATCALLMHSQVA